MTTINHNISEYVYIAGSHSIETKRSYNYLDYPKKPDGWMSPCNGQYEGDKELVEWLQIEAYNLFGVKIIYYEASYDKKYDRIWGEDSDRQIVNSWNLKSYFPLPKEEKIWSKFGIEGMNTFSMFVSKKVFKHFTNDYIPQVGDITQTVFDDKLYEITEVKEESPMYFQSKQYTWELIVRPMKVEQEISVSPLLSATPIAKYYKVDDILDIRTDTDIELEDDNIKYTPTPIEKPKEDPFGNW